MISARNCIRISPDVQAKFAAKRPRRIGQHVPYSECQSVDRAGYRSSFASHMLRRSGGVEQVRHLASTIVQSLVSSLKSNLARDHET